MIGLLYLSFWHGGAQGEIAKSLLDIAYHKTQLPRIQAFAAGILCNLLVCLGIWLATV